MGTFRDLKVWQKGMDLARKVYNLCKGLPKDEIHGLTDQMRRCVVSIPSNIAEGYGRDSNNEKIHFLFISLGSSNELETQLILSHDFGYVGDEAFKDALKLNTEVNKMLSSLIYTLRYPH
jgi:four helix bundle protein